MPKAVIETGLCQPDACAGGKCPARRVCPTRAIVQMEPYDPPSTDPQRCRGCARCAPECPLHAIRLA